MSINGITNLNQYAMMQMVKSQVGNQSKTAAATTVKAVNTAQSNPQASKSATSNDIAGRLAKIPNLEQYEDVIQRFLSGESELEIMGKGHKPLTEDQIALRKLMREYMSTDTRSTSQIASDMQQASKNFRDYWQANGNGAPAPGRVISSDGSFQIFNSKDEKDEYRKNTTLDFLKDVMSVINTRKNNVTASKSNCLDVTV